MSKRLHTGGVDLDVHEELVDITFDEPGSHLAVVHALQQPANGCPDPLLLKSALTAEQVELIKALEQVNVRLSMEEFLRKFFDMWYDDAEMLAKLLGFETEHEYRKGMSEDDMPCNHEEYLEQKLDKIEILRSKEYDILDTPFAELEGETRDAATEALTVLFKSLSNEDNLKLFNEFEAEDSPSVSEPSTAPVEEVTKATTGHNPEEETEEMKIEDILKSAEMQDFLKQREDDLKADLEKKAEKEKVELEKANKAELEKQASRIAELEKAKAELEKAEQQRLEKKYKQFADDLVFVEDDGKEDVVKALMDIQTSNPEAAVTMFNTLEKARTHMEDALMEEVGYHGHIEKGADPERDALNKLIDAKYND